MRWKPSCCQGWPCSCSAGDHPECEAEGGSDPGTGRSRTMTAPAGTQGHLVSASVPLSAASPCPPQVLHLAELWLRAQSRLARHRDALAQEMGGKQASCFPSLSYSYQIPCEPGRGWSPPSLPFAKPALDYFCRCCPLPLPAPCLVDILFRNKIRISLCG